MPAPPRVCYCTNVHPGTTPDEILAQLDEHDPRPHRDTGGDEYPIGLWLSDEVAETLDADDDLLTRFAGELQARDIQVVTLNGFPQRNFHQPVVKHDVYRPNWTQPARLEHTLRLARVLTELMPEGSAASISTLPIGWRADLIDDESSERILDAPALNLAAELLTLCARELNWLAGQTGRTITLDLEPEPGCLLDTAPDVLAWWQRLRSKAEPYELEHLGVCHDVCHSAVMFEPQDHALRSYAEAGVPVHKVQVSSAIRAALTPEAIVALNAFDEPRYLHQTAIRTPDGARFFEDLTDMLALTGPDPTAEARVHFHVPIFLESLGPLGTTQAQIHEAVRHSQELSPRPVFELETYAWNVLPEAHRPATLAHAIAMELDWFVRTFPQLAG
ncbi:MAG: metabolite traffic protein EboE [Phycisphaerales bacterium JB040]